MDILAELSKAAERGVEVTIFTNGGPVPTLRFKWTHESKWWGAVSTFRAAGLELRVIDKDGDASEWVLRQGKTVIAEGESWDWHPYYHFDACLMAAEAALLDEVRRRRSALSSSTQPEKE